ncbi:rubrerythrin [Methanosalsum natronophilum]|uniref:rubrerythrin n=1 Tax=Methanosalsum natronophilum TaxID=768733 RepID=UPI002167BA69|nr:rubrerythrin family protein [Methanosalsum natronophilum]MCS3924029.1 rubrerythrin [Methanosalsum natronophilum]
MTSIKGTKTEINLLTAFAGESQARNRYDYFASVAKKEGYEQISAIFQDTAKNEKEHAKRLFKFLEGGEATINDSYPAGIISDTKSNLLAAADGENHEHSEMYPDFAEVADKEGFLEIAEVFRNIAKAEIGHEDRFRALAKNIEDGIVFKKNTKATWRCRNCGYIHEGPEAPEECPACAHPQAHFEIKAENY